MADKENNKTGCLAIAVGLALLAGGGFLLAQWLPRRPMKSGTPARGGSSGRKRKS